MNGRRWVLLAVVGVGPVLMATLGCLKRTERIHITSDGAVTVAIVYEGQRDDFETLDALPSAASGWKVSREVKQEEGKENVTLTAERRFAPREDLPSTYAAPGDAFGALALSFPTTLQRERRADGVYLHFRRVYKPREWKYVDYWSEAIIDDNVKKLGEKKPEDLSADERGQIIRAFAEVEARKQVEFAERALKSVDEGCKPDHWLLARKALLEVFEEQTDWDELGRRVEDLAQPERDEELERASKRVVEQGRGAFVRSLRDAAGMDGERIAKVEAALEREERSYEITNQLAGHAFQILVTMPGTVVVHNGDKTDGDEVVWEFDGNAFRDRTYELMATAKLPLERGDQE